MEVIKGGSMKPRAIEKEVKDDKENRTQIDELKVAIQKDKAERTQKCIKEIDATLKKYNCRLDGVMMLKDNSVKSQVTIMALDSK